MAQQGLLVVVSGPSGVGKSTLCKTMISNVPKTSLSISCTTRQPRPAEQDGVDYHFLEEDRFREMIQRDEFVEWAEVYGKLYGTPKQQLTQAMDQGIDVLLDIEAQGARQIMDRYAGAVYVFVAPPSLNTLRTRLYRRAGDSAEEIQRRLQKAQDEIANYRSYHYLIRNEDLLEASKELEAVILAERIKTQRLDTRWLIENRLVENPEKPDSSSASYVS
ncbi:MAG: guanylate kinase [Nitrospirota bacterium]|nr:guanylate kinase [Nitrospirota bacterium]